MEVSLDYVVFAWLISKLVLQKAVEHLRKLISSFRTLSKTLKRTSQMLKY